MNKKNKKTPGEIIESYEPALPTKTAAFAMRRLIGAATFGSGVKYEYLFDKKGMKGRQVLILADHASTDSYLYVLRGYPFVEPNVVIGYQNIFIRGIFGLFLKCGIIPKKLYEPDLRPVISMLRIVRAGGSLLLFPEGIQSMDGSTQPINPATAEFVKRCGIDVVLCKSHGAYLNHPRFDPVGRKGRLRFTYELLFTADELKELDAADIGRCLTDRFRYNDFAENRRIGSVYRGRHKNAYGLEKILFICPFCKKRFSLKVEKDRVVCECGAGVRVGTDYSLIPDDGLKLPFEGLDGWFAYERDQVRKDVSEPGFALSYPARLCRLNTSGRGGEVTLTGEGRVTLKRGSFLFEGTENGAPVSYDMRTDRIPSAPFVSGRGNEFFYKGEYFRFIPKDRPGLPVYCLLAVEELHDLDDPKWRLARADASGETPADPA
ncbi:MAG: hypothetical protein J6V01_02580 [Clostridia bacterium]|nr:hypothetical protein [Clostridia bacterium]